MEEKQVTQIVSQTQASLYVNNEELVVFEHLDWLIKETNTNIEKYYLGGFYQVLDKISVPQPTQVCFTLSFLESINTPTLRKYIQKCNKADWKVELNQWTETTGNKISIILDKITNSR